MSVENEADFDRFAADYDTYIQKGLRLAGESKEHFAQARVDWTRTRLCSLGHAVDTVLDYGCGTGTSTPMLLDTLGAQDVLGVDLSQRSLDLAERRDGLRYGLLDETEPDGTRDLAFTNGVFHHIPHDDQAGAVGYLREFLRPGGVVALWENNPYNPATRYGMRANEFDRDCVMVRPARARELLRNAGFTVLKQDFMFIFPHVLRSLRWIEPRVSGLPVGGQYVVLAQRA